MAKSYAAQQRRAKRRKAANPHRVGNAALASAMADLRQSGAAGTHQEGHRGQRTRSGAKAAAIRDSSG